MTEKNGMRRRVRNYETDKNENVLKGEEDTRLHPQRVEFQPRDSPLTELMRSSLHIRAIYNIFVVILVMLFLDTVIFDLVERGKINVGWGVVVAGFGDTGRAARLWLFELSMALAFYPALLFYTAGARTVSNFPVLLRVWGAAGTIGLLAMLMALAWVPMSELFHVHLAMASAVSVVCEMLRFGMKIYAVAIACAPRYRETAPALPTFRHYVYFLFAPTLLYRDSYPRTKQIRWGVVVFHLMEVAAIIFYNSFLWERFILPYWSEYGKEKQVEAGTVVRGMFACVLPGVLSFLCGFYCLLHAWLNVFAEMLTFADRLFYEEWWTSSQFERYYRAWNRVVHGWLRDHLYRPLAPRAGRVLAIAAVFLISAAAHELVLALAFGFFYPVLLIMFGVCGMLLVPITSVLGRRYPHALNLAMWLSFFCGNGILWSLYPMEYFARKNCPPSENDSFFIPKSWSCPEIVLKPNWEFHNPLVTLT